MPRFLIERPRDVNKDRVKYMIEVKREAVVAAEIARRLKEKGC